MSTATGRAEEALRRPRVTVLLPVYNSRETFAEAITSILSQTLADFEVVAVDDGSTDGTGDLVDAFARKDPRIRPFHPGRIGLVAALNLGLDAALAPYIARFDGDDRAHPERLERQTSFLDAHPHIAVVGCLVSCFAAGEVGEGFRVYEAWLNGLVTTDDIHRAIFIESPLVHPSVSFRKAVIVREGGYRDLAWPEDYELWLRLHTAGHRFAKVPAVLHHWREHPGRLTRTDGRYSVENFLRVKAHYLRKGPLAVNPRAIIWGAGQFGRRIAKHLEREGAELVAFTDIDPRKVGNTRRGAPIVAPEELPSLLRQDRPPIVLAAVPSRGARALIRGRLQSLGLAEGAGFFCVA